MNRKKHINEPNKSKYAVVPVKQDSNNDISSSILFNQTWSWTGAKNQFCDKNKNRFDELNQMYKILIEKINQDEEYTPCRYGITKKLLIDFFRKALPLIFKISFFGGMVMSILSDIQPNDIDMVVNNTREMEEFIAIMENIFGLSIKSIQLDESLINHCLIYTSKGMFKEQEKLQYIKTTKPYDVASFVFDIDRINIKFNIALKDSLCLNDFDQTNLLWGQSGFSLLHRL